MASAYVINFSDPTTPSVVVNPGQIYTGLSINLVGQGATGYGEHLNENLVHMLENFAHTAAPSNPLEGQLWYDKGTNQFFTWNSTAWVPISAAHTHDSLYVNVTGDSMTGALAMGTNKITGLGDATLATDALNMQTGDARYVNISGDTMTGILDMGGSKITSVANATVATDALNMQTGDARYVNISGDTMTGALTLNADPTLALHAATKQYVDVTYVSGSTLSIPTSSAILMRFLVPKAMTIPSGFTSSLATSAVAPTASTTYLIQRDGSTIGTLTYTTAAGVFADSVELGSHSFTAGQLLTVVAPVAPDATHDGLSWTIAATFT